MENKVSFIIDAYFSMDISSSATRKWIGRLRALHEKKKLVMDMDMDNLYRILIERYSHLEHLKLFEFFLEWCVPPTSLLELVIKKGDDLLLRFLMNRGMRCPDLNLHDILSDKQVMEMNHPILRQLLSHKIYSLNERGDTLLHSLLRNAEVSKNKLIVLLGMVIDAGVNVSHVNKAGLTGGDLLMINSAKRPLSDVRMIADVMKKKHALVLLDSHLSQQYHDLNKSFPSK